MQDNFQDSQRVKIEIYDTQSAVNQSIEDKIQTG